MEQSLKTQLEKLASELPVLCQVSEVKESTPETTLPVSKTIQIGFYHTNHFITSTHYKPISKIVPIHQS